MRYRFCYLSAMRRGASARKTCRLYDQARRRRVQDLNAIKLLKFGTS
jgi:hypothetical protein